MEESKFKNAKSLGETWEESKFKNAKSLGETRESKYLLRDFEAFGHLLKGTLGTGILATPMAFKHSGIWAGLVATLILGALVYYGIHMLVKCNHVLCWRIERPYLKYEQLMEESFKNGPKKCQRISTFSRYLVLVVLGSLLIGVCCVYIIFISLHIQAVVKEIWSDVDLDVRVYIVMLAIPVILLNSIKTLKFMVPASVIGVLLMLLVLTNSSYYMIVNYHSPCDQPAITTPLSWPTYFGMVLFGLEGAPSKLSVENSMRTPEHLISPPCLILIEMTIVTAVTSLFGFFGYAAFGDEVKATISFNFPSDALANITKLLLCVAMFLSIALNFYVPYNMIHDVVKHKFVKHPALYESLLRAALSLLLIGIAVALPLLGPFVSLLGSLSLYTLGFIFPALLETIIYWENPGMGYAYWRLVKNILLSLFGIIGVVTNSALAINDIVKVCNNPDTIRK